MWPFRKKEAPETPLHEGQVWQGSTHWYVIGRLDILHDVAVVSVTAYNDADLTDEFAAHLPFSEPTFRSSAVHMMQAQGAVSDSFINGYETWREAYDQGEAGVW